MSTYTAIYEDGHTGIVKHAQVDTGLGFTCDAGVKNVVVAFNEAGWKTNHSCEATNNWYVPRCEIGFGHADPHKLLDFCLHLKTLIPKSGFQTRMILDNYFYKELVSVVIEYDPALESRIFTAIATFTGKV
jgi:hypothetical protein